MKRIFQGASILIAILVIMLVVDFYYKYQYHQKKLAEFEEVRQKTSARINNVAAELGIGSTIISCHTPSGDPWYASYLRYRNAEDQDLRHFEPLQDAGLRGLSLAESGITDDGLFYLRNLNNLWYLDLSHTEISDEGLQELRPLSKLQKLDISFTNVTQKGAAFLEQLPKLEAVYAEGTPLKKVEGVKVYKESSGEKFITQDLSQ